MSAFHQMGHDSINLLGAKGLAGFKGAIVSPVNYEVDDVVEHVKEHQRPNEFDFIFDPQMYVPQNAMDGLKKWSYFPKDSSTADISNLPWWYNINSELIKSVDITGVKILCSPAAIPKVYTDDYYDHIVAIGTDLANKVGDKGMSMLQTAIVSFPQMSEKHFPNRISSIISKTRAQKVYLIFHSDVEPRREFNQSDCLSGCMKLISNLKDTGLEVTVGFCSSDVILWKAAGADHCATGKFFNLRRFTPSRFLENEGGGGGQLPYWFDESFFAFFREADLLRLEKNGFFDFDKSANPYAQDIKTAVTSVPQGKWVGLSWRQYMAWFLNFEKQISEGKINPKELLKIAEQNWVAIDEKGILMDEVRNDGGWIRSWRQAINEYKQA